MNFRDLEEMSKSQPAPFKLDLLRALQLNWIIFKESKHCPKSEIPKCIFNVLSKKIVLCSVSNKNR